MKKATLHRLKEVAATLPPMEEQVIGIVSGEDLIEKGITEAKPGEPVFEDTRYKGPVIRTICHLTRIKKAWNRGGDQAVEDYCQEVSYKYQKELQAKLDQKKVMTA